MTAPTQPQSSQTPPPSAAGRAPDSDDARFQDPHFPDASRGPRTASGARRDSARRTLLDTIRLLPQYVRLLGGLLGDKRVALLDKALVAGAIAYIVSPIDLIPDFIPFLGEVDDVFVLMLALERLVAHADAAVLADHWKGSPEDLAALDLRGVISAATVFLPGGVRNKLVGFVTNRGKAKA